MNAVFFVFCTLSMIILCFISPDKVMDSFLKGAERSLLLSASLITVYSVWLGVFEVLERSGANDKFANVLKRPVKKLFFCPSETSAKYIALNISANALGLGGVATPLGIKACAALEQENNTDAASLLLIIAATSVQILPTSVLALMAKYGSANPSTIIAPCFLSTIVSSVAGIAIFMLLRKIKKLKTKKHTKNVKRFSRKNCSETKKEGAL